MRLRPFILCFNRTAISIQKIDSKSSKSHLKLFSRISSKSYRHNAVSNRFLSQFSTSLTNAPRLLSQAKWVHTRLSEKDRTQGHTRRNRGRFGWGGVSLPSERSTRFGNPAWPGFKTANFAAFGSWSETLLKNAESLRSSDALMRVAVPKRRGPAGPRRPTPPAERTVLAPISPRVQLCLRRPAFPLSAFIPGA